MRKIILLLMLVSISVISYSQCDNLEKTSDDMTGKVRISTPMYNTKIGLYNQSVMKVESEKDTSYYLILTTKGSTLNVGEKGVIVLFEDGTKWIRSEEEIKTKYYGGDEYTYTAFMLLTSEDLIVFSTKQIKKFRLYIYDGITNIGSNDFMQQIKCIINTK